MAKYFFQANYIGEGVKGLMKDGGSSRIEQVEKAMKSVGGQIESFYYAFGDTDALGIGEFPDAASAAALSMMVNASGTVSVKLTPLITPEEMDEASQKTPSYSPPGQ